MGGSDFDPRVTIAVGLLRWLMDYQISEIQILLESRGISISTGEISNLSREFLLHFYCIHRRHMKDMELKEYMLHLDGTGESGGEIVFMAKDSITGITMDACIMPSESSEYITPFLQGISDTFGEPVSVLRNMGIAIKESVSIVFPGILQLICHYHFIKALGKDAFSSYTELRSSMVSTKALAAISGMSLPEKGDGIVYAEKLWIAIASEYIVRRLEADNGKLILIDNEIEGCLKRTVTPIGTSRKADVPKRYIGRRVYVIITKNPGTIQEKGKK